MATMDVKKLRKLGFKIFVDDVNLLTEVRADHSFAYANRTGNLTLVAYGHDGGNEATEFMFRIAGQHPVTLPFAVASVAEYEYQLDLVQQIEQVNVLIEGMQNLKASLERRKQMRPSVHTY